MTKKCNCETDSNGTRACPVCSEPLKDMTSKPRPFHPAQVRPYEPVTPDIAVEAFHEIKSHMHEEGVETSRIILKAMINKALSNIEKIPYYNCEAPCGLVRKFGIEWCECDRHERPHPALSPGCPDYTKDMIACLRVADDMKLIVVFSYIEGCISIRKGLGRAYQNLKIIEGDVCRTLSLMLYEMIRKEGNG